MTPQTHLSALTSPACGLILEDRQQPEEMSHCPPASLRRPRGHQGRSVRTMTVSPAEGRESGTARAVMDELEGTPLSETSQAQKGQFLDDPTSLFIETEAGCGCQGLGSGARRLVKKTK